MPFEREKFNSDPKHEKERNQFDEMVEDSVKRIATKNKKPNDPAPTEKTFVDDFLEGLFGRGS